MDTAIINGKEYVLVPKAEYLRLKGGEAASPARTEAGAYMLELIGHDLRAAREHAGFTQAELAEKIGKAQGTVSSAEGGKIRVSEKYIKAVLKACKLPADWVAP